MSEVNTGLIDALCHKAVDRRLFQFEQFRDIEPQDLVAFARLAALSAHRSYDPAKARYSTWIMQRINSRLTDLLSTRINQRNRERTHAQVLRDIEKAAIERGDVFDVREESSLADWLGGVYRNALLIPNWPGRRRPQYHPAQAFAMAALKTRRDLSTRGLLALLAQRPDLMAALQLERLPSRRGLDAAVERITKKFTILRAIKELAGDGAGDRRILRREKAKEKRQIQAVKARLKARRAASQ